VLSPLRPREQRAGLEGVGLWLDTESMAPEETVDAILAGGS
jgi:hypothetical protein